MKCCLSVICFSSFLPFFKRSFRLKKRAMLFLSGRWRVAVRAVKGAMVFAFTGAQRTPLTGGAGG